MSTVTIWRIQLVRNNLGVWDSEWFATPAEARKRFKELIREGYDPDSDDGTYGSLLEPEEVTVPLTKEGLLDFANRFAVDEA